MPADVGSPRNHTAAPAKAGPALIIIGIREDSARLAVITRPCAVSASALMTSMEMWAPALTAMAGSVRPAIRKVLSGLAGTTRRTLVRGKVIVCWARLAVAPAGIRAPSQAARAGATRVPGAYANRAPMTFPASPED